MAKRAAIPRVIAMTLAIIVACSTCTNGQVPVTVPGNWADIFIVTLDVDCTMYGGGKSTGQNQLFVDTMMAQTNQIYSNCTQGDVSSFVSYSSQMNLVIPCKFNITTRGQLLQCSWLKLSSGSGVDDMSLCTDLFVFNATSVLWTNFYNMVVLLPFPTGFSGTSTIQKSNLTSTTYPYPIHMGSGSDATGTGNYLAHELGHGRYGLDHARNETADFDSLARSYPGPGTYRASPGHGDAEDLMGMGNVGGCFGAVHADHLGWTTQDAPGSTPQLGNVTLAGNPAFTSSDSFLMKYNLNQRLSYLNYKTFTALDKTHQYYLSFRKSTSTVNGRLIPQMQDVLMLHRGNIQTHSTDVSSPVILRVFRTVGDSYISPAGDFTVNYAGKYTDPYGTGNSGVLFQIYVPNKY